MDPFVYRMRGTAERTERSPPTSHRSTLGKLSDSWLNSQSNRNCAQGDSLLHASAEALLLLNSAQISHTDFADLASSSAEKENVYNYGDGIPITAPVPLSYAVRGKEALKFILSIGEEDGEDEDERGPQQLNDSIAIGETRMFQDEVITTFPQIEITAPTPGPVLPIFDIFYIPQNRTTLVNQPWHTVNESLPTRHFVRSISPSTLMALTEPCLIAWCFDPDLSFDTNAQFSSMNAQVYDVSSIPPVYDGPINVIHVPRNEWGY